MKRTLTKPLSAISAAALLLTPFWQAAADPAEAEDAARRMGLRFKNKDFLMAPTDHSGVLGQGERVKFLIPVNKGLDYVFLVGSDNFVQDLDVYIYDDVGSLILDDRRALPFAAVQFRANYTGEVIVHMVMRRVSANSLGSWYVLVGRRGVPRDPSGGPPLAEEAEDPRP